MDLQAQVLAAFQTEHREQLEGIRTVLRAAEAEPLPAGDARWTHACRMAHTLKGGARICGLKAPETLSHRMESLLACIRDGTLAFSPQIAEALRLALDTVEDWMAALAAREPQVEPLAALAAIERLLSAASQPTRATTGATTSEPPIATAPAEGPECAAAGRTPPARQPLGQNAERRRNDAAACVNADEPARVEPVAPDAPQTAAQPGSIPVETLRVRTAHLDSLLRAADELINVRAQEQATLRTLAELQDQSRVLLRECQALESVLSRSAESRSPEPLRLAPRVERISRQARRLAARQRVLYRECQGIAWVQDRQRAELFRAARQARMVVAESVLQGLGSMVRRLARDEGKKIAFHASGLDVQADRMVLQEIKDAVMHLLRNAVVHGIEPADERLARGKSGEGRITLTLAVSGDRLEVAVSDDGRGIDFERVRREALRRGVVGDPAAGDAQALSRLLFAPGFSTATRVTELAGRGIGLSVVYERALRLGGEASVLPSDGPGTRFALTVPLSVSGQRVLLVACGGQTFAFPTFAVDRLLRVRHEEIQTIEGRRLVKAGASPLPVAYLGEYLAIGCRPAVGDDGLLSVVVLRLGARRTAVLVDAFLEERDAVVRSIDDGAASGGAISGGIACEAGRVALMVGVKELMDGAINGPAGRPAPSEQVSVRPSPATAERDRPRRILVVDDSFTTRTLEKSILEANGYDVCIAVDGVEALTCLRCDAFDLVVADVQMPRMDGLTLLREVKKDPRLRRIPVILVTSLDQPADKERGVAMGASEYIVKRKFDHQDLLATIERLL